MKYKVCWSKTDKGLRPYLQHPCCAHRIKTFEVFFDNLEDAVEFAKTEVGEELFEPAGIVGSRDFTDEELTRITKMVVVETGSEKVVEEFDYVLVPQDELYNL